MNRYQEQFSVDQPPPRDGQQPPYPPPGAGGPPRAAPPTLNAPPPSGYRIPLAPGQPFPQGAVGGPPPFRDLDGSPVYIGSALFNGPDSVHPCKIVPQFDPPARVPYAGTEHGAYLGDRVCEKAFMIAGTEHRGRYDLLPFVPEQMEWVRTSGGRIPPGRRPVEVWIWIVSCYRLFTVTQGGYEDNGGHLFHAYVNIHGVDVPGKTGEHLVRTVAATVFIQLTSTSRVVRTSPSAAASTRSATTTIS
jgi:hypothetical protein